MVAKIVTGKSIRGILVYNENKVQQGTAQLIMASGFALEIEKLNFHQKLLRFTKLSQLNPTVRTNAMHISLNFDPSDGLDTAKMQQVAQAYMEGIGFGDQPFLVYRHNDAGHPHLHIATSLIRPDGKRLHTHDIGRLVSEPARKSIEKEFRLVRAEGRKLAPTNYIRPVAYGQKPIKQAMASVLASVIGNYLFSSIAEFNAILAGFNIRAETGSKDSVMFQKRGLLYTVLDSNGSPIGVPIKASNFHFKPTLANLEQEFEKKQVLKKNFREALKARIDQSMKKGIPTGDLLKKELAGQGIDLVIRRNGDGKVFGMTYVDHKQRLVYNGSDLGKAYAASEVMAKLWTGHVNATQMKLQFFQDKKSEQLIIGNPLESLLQKSPEMDGLAFARKKRKKRKGRNL